MSGLCRSAEMFVVVQLEEQCTVYCTVYSHAHTKYMDYRTEDWRKVQRLELATHIFSYVLIKLLIRKKEEKKLLALNESSAL